MKKLKPYALFLLVIFIDLLVLVSDSNLGTQILKNTYKNFSEMISVIPPVFLLLGLMDVWVPRETIIRFLGDKSGLMGIILSIFMGAAAAGPLYGAFP